jgi:hypothetical protein
MDVFGNAVEIANGDATPSVSDDTDFGSSPVSVSVDHVFTIQNNGNANLTLTDASPYVTVTGADFQLITPYPIPFGLRRVLRG